MLVLYLRFGRVKISRCLEPLVCIKSTKPWTTVLMAFITASRFSHDGDGASVNNKILHTIYLNTKGQLCGSIMMNNENMSDRSRRCFLAGFELPNLSFLSIIVCHLVLLAIVSPVLLWITAFDYPFAELQIKKKNSCQTLGPASKRVLPDLLFFFFFFYKFFNISLSIQYD